MNYVYNSGLNFYALYMDCYDGESSSSSSPVEGAMKRYAFDMKHYFPKEKSVRKLMEKLAVNRVSHTGCARARVCLWFVWSAVFR